MTILNIRSLDPGTYNYPTGVADLLAKPLQKRWFSGPSVGLVALRDCLPGIVHVAKLQQPSNQQICAKATAVWSVGFFKGRPNNGTPYPYYCIPIPLPEESLKIWE